MTDSSCTVPHCDDSVVAWGMCSKHYQRWKRTGQTDLQPRTVQICSVPDCGEKIIARGWCTKHYDRWKRTGVVTSWMDDIKPSYKSVHANLQKDRGPASNHSCVDCARPAVQWSYQHDCPEEQNDGVGIFCLHPEHYVPRCMTCHMSYDGFHPTGEQHHNVKLTEAQVRWVRSNAIGEKLTHEQMAWELDVSRSTIGDIINRRTWKDVE